MNIIYRRKTIDGENSYEVRVPLTGGTKRWTITIRARTLQGARRIANKMRKEGKIPEDYSDAPAAHSPTIFQDFVEIWKEEHYPTLAPRTQVNYDSILKNYILEFFARRPLKKLSVEDVRRFLQYLRTSDLHQTRSGKLSATMVNKCYKLLSEILSAAAEKMLIAGNPCLKLSEKEIPSPQYAATPIWTPEELNRFFLHLQGIPKTYPNFQKEVMFYATLMTGMRKGEISVLQWSDIDTHNNSIRITKALKNMSSTEINIAAPKTKHSRREIFIDDYTMELFHRLYDMQKEYLLQSGAENPQQYVFITQRRKSREIIPVTPSYLYIWLRKEARKCGLPLIKVHSIRHMAATYALANGAPILGVQNMMGHTSLKTTSIYLHLMEEQKQQTANVLAAKLAALRTDDPK